MRTIKDYVIDSICKMNINLLDVLMEDDSVINNIKKEIWLDKFNTIFNYLQNFDINELSIGSISNNSPNAYEVLFYSTVVEKPFYFKLGFRLSDSSIVDIHQVDTQPIINNEIVSNFFLIKILIFKDDLSDFQPSIKYRTDIGPYKDALALFWPKLNDVVVTHEQIENWLEEHVDLYDALNPNKLQYKFQYYFYRLYNYFNDLENCLNQDNEYETANDEFLLINKNDTEEIRAWYNNYEHLYAEIKSMDNYQIPKEYFILSKNNELVKVNYEFNILTDSTIYNNFVQFKLNIESILDILQVSDPALEDY